MLVELTAILNRVPDSDPETVQNAVVLDNLLGKPTGTARRLALSRLNALYGILTRRLIQRAALRLWSRNVTGRPLPRPKGPRAGCFWLESRGDSRIGDILIQPVGWAEASRNAEAIFARLARPGY
jgi:hypothetical protein